MDSKQLELMSGIISIIAGHVQEHAYVKYPVTIEEIGLHGEIEEYMGPELFCELVDKLESNFKVRFNLETNHATVANMFLTVCNSESFSGMLSTESINEFINNVEIGLDDVEEETSKESVSDMVSLVSETVGIVDVYTNDSQETLLWECCEFYGICQDYDIELDKQYPAAIVKTTDGTIRSVYAACVKFKPAH